MAMNVLSFANRVADRPDRADWSNAELAELYRVEHALVQARVSIETDRGVTDEGDPWFVFCRPDGEVVVHITRFGGLYRLYSPALPKPLTGLTFSALTKSFLSGLRTPVQPTAGVSIHPAALLSVLVAAIFFSIDFHSNAAHASELVSHGAPDTSAQAQLSPLPTKETLFHSLVANLKAFIDSATPWDSQHSARLAVVESAAITAMLPLAGLAESVMNVSPVTMAAALTDIPATHDQTDVSSELPWRDYLNTSITSADLKTLFDQGSILAAQENAHLNWTKIENSALTWQGNQFSTQISFATAANLGQSGPSTPSHQFDVGTLQDGLAIPDFGASRLSSTGTHTDAKAIGSAQSALTGEGSALTINLAQGSQSVDLSALPPIQAIEVGGNGSLQIGGITDANAPQIAVNANATLTIGLYFLPAAHPAETIQLNGHDVVALTTIATSSPVVNVTLDSEGSSSNSVVISDTAVADTTTLDITVTGTQDLTLNETAQTFSKSHIQTKGLSGALKLGLDLNNAPQALDLSQVAMADFNNVNNGDTAKLNATPGSQIQLNVNLDSGDISDSIVGLTSSETVNVGRAKHTDVVVNEITVGIEQANIDQQVSLTAAAQVASSFADSPAAHQALLFTYQGNVYVFIDANGSHTFNPNNDAIINLVGLAASTDLSGVFHSA